MVFQRTLSIKKFAMVSWGVILCFVSSKPWAEPHGSYSLFGRPLPASYSLPSTAVFSSRCPLHGHRVLKLPGVTTLPPRACYPSAPGVFPFHPGSVTLPPWECYPSDPDTYPTAPPRTINHRQPRSMSYNNLHTVATVTHLLTLPPIILKKKISLASRSLVA